MRGIGGKIAGIDAALEFGERDHGHRFLWRAYRFYGPDVDRTSGCVPRVFVMAGLVPAMLASGMRTHSNRLIAISGWAKLIRCTTEHPTQATSPTPSGSTGCG